jgi:hypothetical protein
MIWMWDLRFRPLETRNLKLPSINFDPRREIDEATRAGLISMPGFWSVALDLRG